MKTPNILPSILFGTGLFLAASWPNLTYANSFVPAIRSNPGEKTRVVEKSFQLAATDWVEIDCRYGEVHVETAASGSTVDIKVELSVEARNDEAAQGFLDMLLVDIEQSRGKVRVETGFKKEIRKMNSDGEETKFTFTNGDKFKVDDYEVVVHISMPQRNNLRTKLNFSDLYVGDLDGEAEIDLQYGNLKAETLQGNTELNLQFSEARIDHLAKARLVMAYSDLELSTAGELNIDGSFSTYKIDEIDKMNSRDGYNDYELGKVGSLVFEEKFSGVEIDELTGHGEVHSEYGHIDLGRVVANFGSLNLKCNFTDIEMELPAQGGVSLNIKTDLADFDMDMSGLTIEEDEKGATTRRFKAHRGDGANVVNIDASYGSLELKQP